MNAHPTPEFRYERKYISYDYSTAELRNFVLLSDAVFSPIYHTRQVNSIYFDTPDFEYFQQNLQGDQHRKKIRVRWYGNDEQPHKIQLESKIKDGDLMRKESIVVSVQPDSNLQNSAFLQQLTRLVRSHFIITLPEAQGLVPVLANTYQREYFFSPRTQIRITVDDQIGFQSISEWTQNVQQRKTTFSILECKYPLVSDSLLQTVTQSIPIQVSKSSKYLLGITQSYPHLTAA